MKLLNGGRRCGFPAARRALCVIMVVVATLGLPAPVQADGLYTHTVIVERAIAKLIELDNLDPQNDYSELTAILKEYGGYVNYGAVFPDTASAPEWLTGVDQHWGECVADTTDLRENWKTYGPVYVPHQQPTRPVPRFRAALMAQLLKYYKENPRSEEGKELLAFLFGLISHQEADVSWHPFGANPNAMETKIPSPWNELSIDNLLVYYDDPRGILDPVQGNQVAFDLNGVKPVIQAASAQAAAADPAKCPTMPENIGTGETFLETGWSQASDWMNCWLGFCDEVRDLVENHVPGGIEDAAALTAVAWIETWDMMEAYAAPVTTISLSPAQPEDNDGSYRRPVTIELSATGTLKDTGPFKTYYSVNGEQFHTRPFETYYRVNGDAEKLYTGPFTISSEGVHEISAYSRDALSIKGDAANETVIIAPKPPINQPCPAGPQPSGECTLQPPPYYVVINGQQNCLDRDGSGCSPLILGHPECTDCATCNVDVESEACKPHLTGVVPEGQTEVVYEMCQAGDAWRFRVRTLDSMGNCPIDEANPDWLCGLPPGTGIKLPAPLIVGGLAILGAGFIAAGLVLRRRKS